MKSLRSILIVCISCCLACLTAACSTIACGEPKVIDGNRVEITASRNGVTNALSGMVRGFGQNIPVPQASGALRNLGNAVRDQVISDAEARAIAEAARPEVEAYIRENPDKFCDKCENGDACEANPENLKLTLESYEVLPGGGVKAKFKLEGKITCGECPECEEKAVIDGSAGGKSHSCESIPQIVIDGKAVDADLVLETIGGEDALQRYLEESAHQSADY